MAEILDLEVYRKEPLIVKSLTGETYNIDGNFSTEFYLYMFDAYSKIQKLKNTDYANMLEVLKQFTLEIIKLDRSKVPTMETVETQFGDIGAQQALIDYVVKHANGATKNPT